MTDRLPESASRVVPKVHPRFRQYVYPWSPTVLVGLQPAMCLAVVWVWKSHQHMSLLNHQQGLSAQWVFWVWMFVLGLLQLVFSIAATYDAWAHLKMGPAVYLNGKGIRFYRQYTQHHHDLPSFIAWRDIQGVQMAGANSDVPAALWLQEISGRLHKIRFKDLNLQQVQKIYDAVNEIITKGACYEPGPLYRVTITMRMTYAACLPMIHLVCLLALIFARPYYGDKNEFWWLLAYAVAGLFVFPFFLAKIEMRRSH